MIRKLTNSIYSKFLFLFSIAFILLLTTVNGVYAESVTAEYDKDSGTVTITSGGSLSSSWMITNTSATSNLIPSGMTVNGTQGNNSSTSFGGYINDIYLNGETITTVNTGIGLGINQSTASNNITIYGGSKGSEANPNGKITSSKTTGGTITSVTSGGSLSVIGATIETTSTTGDGSAIQIGGGSNTYSSSLVVDGGAVINNGILLSGTSPGELNLEIYDATLTGSSDLITGSPNSTRTALGSITIGKAGLGDKPSITASGGTALYLQNRFSCNLCTINSGIITGESGIIARGGRLVINGGTISGTGSYPGASTIVSGQHGSNGSAIQIQGGPTTSTQYGAVEVEINTGATLSSSHGPAISQVTNTGQTTAQEQNPANNTLKSIQINGGTINASDGSQAIMPGMIETPNGTNTGGDVTSTKASGFVSPSVATKPAMTPSVINQYMNYGGEPGTIVYTITASNGETYYAVGEELEDKLDSLAAQGISVPEGGLEQVTVSPGVQPGPATPVPATSITLNPNPLQFTDFNGTEVTKNLTITGDPEGSALPTVTGWNWSSSNSSVASVNATSAGATVTVTAKKVGTATITVAAQDNPALTATAVVTVTPAMPQPSEAAKILDLDLTTTNGVLQFYNPSSTVNAQPQQQSFGLDIIGSVPYDNFQPDDLNWTISAVSSPDTPILNFEDSDSAVSSNNASSGTVTMTASENSAWTITYDYTINPGSGNVPATVSYSNLQLNYTGTNTDLSKGVYNLTVSADYPLAYNTNGVSDSIRLNIVDTNTLSATITTAPNSTADAPSRYVQDLADGRTVQFGYVREVSTNNGSSTAEVPMGGNPHWTVVPLDDSEGETEGINASNYMDYVTVNPQTGLVTFLKDFPASSYVVLQLSVDGVSAENQVLLTTNGTISSTDLTGIAPQYNPVYLTASGTNAVYNLVNNIIGVPAGSYVSQDNLSFASSNTAIADVYNDDQLIAVNTNTTGTTTITATLTLDDGSTATTTFDVIYVSNEVAPKGITADETLNLKVDGQEQNVNARLIPENTTTQLTQSQFSYVSSDTNVAVVDSYGNVTPIAEGTATITTTVSTNATFNGNPVSTSGWTATSAKTTVTVTAMEETATSINLDPTEVYLAPTGTENGKTSAEITAAVDPENIDPSLVTWTADSEDITLSETTGLTTTVSSTDATGTFTVTASVPGADGEALTKTATVYVSGSSYILDTTKSNIVAGGGSPGVAPDYFTVNAAVMANPAIEGADTSAVTGVTIFCWSQNDQSDINAKAVTANNNGVYTQVFPVNNTEVNNYFLDASDIKVNVYASTATSANAEMVWAPTWDYCTSSDWDQNVLVTTYSQNIGFNLPSVGQNVMSGTEGQVLGMEGIRLSTPIEGVDVQYSVYVKDNNGWQEQVGEGEYAGTMHENKQIQGVNISLTGDNAAQYDVQYQVHVSNIGWMDWVNEGTNAGDPNFDLQIEAIAVQVVPAGTALPAQSR